MVELAVSPGVPVVAPPTVAKLADNPAVDASIAAYLGAGERMQTLMDITWKACAVLLAIIVLAWAMGILPIAVKLF